MINNSTSFSIASESTPALPHSQVSIDSEVVVSKPDIYHSSMLCVALSDNQKSHTRLHFLREMSISQSSSGKYLVAVSDRTTFIAFQSELDLREWPRKYDSFSEGMSIYHVQLLMIPWQSCMIPFYTSGHIKLVIMPFWKTNRTFL